MSRAPLVLLIALTIAAGCSSGSDDAGQSTDSATTSTANSPSGSTSSTTASPTSTTLPPVVRATIDESDFEGPKPIIDLDGCTPSWAAEGEGPLGLFVRPTEENVPVQLIADPDGLAQSTYAIVQRFATVETSVTAETPETIDVHGVPTRIALGDDGAGEAQWALPTGGEAYLRTRGLDQDAIETLVTALEARSPDTPVPGFDLDPAEAGGMEIVDESRSLHGSWITTSCLLDNGDSVTAVILTGEPVFQYGVALDSPTLPAIGTYDGDLVAANGPADLVDEAVRSIIDTDVQTWVELLAAERS